MLARNLRPLPHVDGTPTVDQSLILDWTQTMEEQACRLPGSISDDQATVIGRMLQARRIAIVGLSDDPYRPSHGVGKYLQSAGYEVIPVNPSYPTVLGLKSYPTLQDIPGEVDVVNVFRRPEHCAEVARQAIAIGAKGIWLQQGITSSEARKLAQEAGVDFVQDRCMKVDHMMQKV